MVDVKKSEKERKKHADMVAAARKTGYKTEEEIEEQNSLPELPPDPRHDVIGNLLKKYPSAKPYVPGHEYLDAVINRMMAQEPRVYGEAKEENTTIKRKGK